MNNIELIKDLLKRAGVDQEDLLAETDETKLRYALECIMSIFWEFAPKNDLDWYYDYYLITGDHMHLTEEGWMPAEMNTFEYTGYEPVEVLWEVNKPILETVSK